MVTAHDISVLSMFVLTYNFNTLPFVSYSMCWCVVTTTDFN